MAKRKSKYARKLKAERERPLSEQEQASLTMLRSQRDPTWWLAEVLGVTPWQKQIEILESVRDNARTAVRSCHGAGKSWIAAGAVLWFLYCHPFSIVLTTAPTFRQVRKVLWQEIRSLSSNAPFPLGSKLLETEIKIAPKWYALGFSTDDPDSAQGIHAEYVLVVVDEASGVEPAIWDALDGCLAGGHSRILSIGNPTDPTGYFAGEFKSSTVAKHKISAFDTPNFLKGHKRIAGLVTPEWVEEKRKRWGETSPLYVARVLGDFPEAGEDTLIHLTWIEAAAERELDATGFSVFGTDIARFGNDETVGYWAVGPKTRLAFTARKADTMETTGKIIRAVAKVFPRGVKSLRIDEVGVGGGVVDRLSELEMSPVGCNAGSGARDKEHFVNARAEWFWGLRERFETGDIDIDPEDLELAAQLSSIKYKIDSRGRIQIESKDDMRKRGLPSPDRADAVAIAFADIDRTSQWMPDTMRTLGRKGSAWRDA